MKDQVSFRLLGGDLLLLLRSERTEHFLIRPPSVASSFFQLFVDPALEASSAIVKVLQELDRIMARSSAPDATGILLAIHRI